MWFLLSSCGTKGTISYHSRPVPCSRLEADAEHQVSASCVVFELFVTPWVSRRFCVLGFLSCLYVSGLILGLESFERVTGIRVLGYSHLLQHQCSPHSLVLVIQPELSCLATAEGTHGQQELGDVVAVQGRRR